MSSADSAQRVVKIKFDKTYSTDGLYKTDSTDGLTQNFM